MVEGLGRPTPTRLTSSLTSDRRAMKWPLACDPRCGAVEALHGRERTRDQIRDQYATGRSGNGWDGCNVVAVVSATDGDGGDASYGLGLGSRCS